MVILRILILITACCVCSMTLAQSLIVCTSNSMPPYNINNEGDGTHIQLLRFLFPNDEFKPQYLPPGRIRHVFNQNLCDIALHAKREGDWQNAYFTSSPLVTFANYAISLKNKRFNINSVNDLANLRVLAWQNAHKRLGSEFANMAKNNKYYSEIGRQLPLEMLMKERVDVIISEPNVIRHLAKMLDIDISSLTFTPLFVKGNSYYFVFKSDAVRKAFEKNITTAYANDSVKQLMDSFSKKFNFDPMAYCKMECAYSKNKTVCNRCK